jgi:NDP-sugar pyrophosphorylase family protein
MVRKAVVFAAGRGARLGKLTEAVPKPLVEVAGRPVLQHVFSGIAAAGVAEVVLIVGYLGEQIESNIGSEFKGMAVRYARQESMNGTARALLLAREHLGDKSFLFAWGDVLVEPSTYARVGQAAGLTSGVLAVNEVDDPCDGAAVYVDAGMRITGIVEKPPRGTSTTRWNNSGIGVLPPAIWNAAEQLQPSERGEYELPRAIAALIDAGEPFVAVPVAGSWFDIGTMESLEAARRMFELRSPALRPTAG